MIASGMNSWVMKDIISTYSLVSIKLPHELSLSLFLCCSLKEFSVKESKTSSNTSSDFLQEKRENRTIINKIIIIIIITKTRIIVRKMSSANLLDFSVNYQITINGNYLAYSFTSSKSLSICTFTKLYYTASITVSTKAIFKIGIKANDFVVIRN